MSIVWRCVKVFVDVKSTVYKMAYIVSYAGPYLTPYIGFINLKFPIKKMALI